MICRTTMIDRTAELDAALVAAVDRSRLAPSILNTQPWRWRVAHGIAELHADRARAVPAVDPVGRQLVMSCGAALLHLRVALRAAGHAPSVEECPNPFDPDLLARVTIGPFAVGDALDEVTAGVLDGVVEHRATHRHRLAGGVPVAVVDALDRAVQDERALLMVLGSPGDRSLIPADGAGAGSGGVPDDSDALLLVLATLGDEPSEWLRAGQALARLWLEATLAGVALQPLSGPVEDAASLALLRQGLRMGSCLPQVVLRGGYRATRQGPQPGSQPGSEPGPQHRSPRRPLGELLSRPS